MKRKLFFVLLFSILLFCMFTLCASAETYSGECGATDADNITWRLNTETGELVISGEGKIKDFPYTDSSGISSVEWRIYANIIKSVTISDGVTAIGWYAFKGCSKIEKVVISDVAAWCGILFYDHKSNPLYYAKHLYLGETEITNLVIPDGVTSIGECAFYNCTALTNITIPDSVTSIGSNAFGNCTGLASITLPFVGHTSTERENTHFGYIFGASLEQYNDECVPTSLKNVVITGGTSIDSSAFSGCSSLTSITIPDSVTSIESSAFSGCSSLTSITIPDSVTSIGSSAFYKCTGLEKVIINDIAAWCRISFVTSSIHQYASNPLYYAHHLYLGESEVINLIIPEGITSVNSYAFSGCNSLTSITIPDSVTSIESGAFYNCTKLEKVIIHDIAEWCGISFNYDSNPLYYAKHLYLGETKITNLVIPEGVKSISEYAFYGGSDLTSITIPNSLTSIGEYAFSGCSSLASITISNSVTSIGEYAFYGCSSLASITIPNSVTSIGKYAFYNCSSLARIILPFVGATLNGTSNTQFGYIFGASSYSDNDDYVPTCLKNVIITSGTSIASYAFYNCIGLISVTIPSSVTSIGECAFYNCYNLIEVCNLTSLTILAGSSNHGYVSYYAKNVYSALSGSKKTFTDENGYIFYDDGTNRYLMGTVKPDTSLSLPADCKGNPYSIYSYTFYKSNIENISFAPNARCTAIGDYAFYGCSLTSITIPDSVTSIGYDAFCNCFIERVIITDLAAWCRISFYNFYLSYASNPLGNADHLYLGENEITDLVIPEGVTSIGSNAFSGCDSLTSITIPDSVTSVGNYAFYDCTGLTSISIGNSVTFIGYDALLNCTELEKVIINDVAAWCGIAFDDYTFNPLYYAKHLYLGENEITDLVIPEGVTSISRYAFYNCSSLTSVTISDSVTSIGEWAFQNCSNLKFVVLSSGLKSTGSSAFTGCSAVSTVYIRTSDLFANLSKHQSLEALLLACDTIAVCKGFTVPESLTTIFPFTAEISYLGTDYIAYSIHEHAWEDATTYIQCKQDGFRGEACTLCSLANGENLTAHTFGEWQKHNATQHKRICVCTLVEYANHNWNNGVITTSATHTTLGVKTFTCSDCGETKTEDVEKLTTHEYGALIPRVDPTCMQAGTLAHYHCTCGLNFDENHEALDSLVIPALGHYVEREGTAMVDSITMTNDTSSPFAVSTQSGGENIWVSTNKKDNSTSIFTIYALYNCTLELKYSVSSENNYDKLIILKNNTKVDEISGSVTWKTKTITLSAGNYLYIKYTKDSSQKNGSDEGYFIISACTQTEITTTVHVSTDEILPTCTQNVVCADCGQEQKAAMGHDRIPHAAQTVTCTEIGWNAYETCSRCTHTTYVEIPATGHTFGDWQKHNATQHKRVCACTEVEYDDHNWNSGEITTPATHLALGVKTYSCSDCSETKTEDVAKTTAHEFGNWQKYDINQHKRVCACTEVEYNDHSWNSGVITTPATHTTLGVKTFTCSDCGETKTENVAKLTAHEFGAWRKHNATQHKRVCACTEVEYDDHSWNNGVITTPATHLAFGVKTFTCTDCSETKTEDVAKLTTHEYGAWQKHDATKHKRVCACTEVEYDDHSWNDGEITTPATHLELGIKTYTCAGCSETKTEDVAKLTTHTYGEWVTIQEAKVGQAGKREKACACGQKVEETIPTLTESSTGQTNTSNGSNSPDNEEESLGTGAVIGIVGGSVAVVGGGGFCLYWFVLRKKKLI